jgi:CO/xanthine dehydrogenase Mo-binding subunit
MTVWSHCQGVFPLRDNLARVIGLNAEDVHIIHAEGAGCYGHNGADDAACDAALLAKALPGRPVRVQWMRQQEFAWEPYGSAMIMEAKAGLDGAGRIVDWQYEVWSLPHSTRPEARHGNNLMPGWHIAQPQPPAKPHNIPQPSGDADRNAVPLYRFPNRKVIEHFIPEMPVRVSALRTLGGYANVFALESFMDELAHAAGVDPVAFRLRHLDDPRAKKVIEATAKAAGWQAGAKGGQGRGRGFAFARYKNHAAYFAVVADVEVDRASGRIRVHKLTGTVDAGQAVNPDGLKNQMEGGAIQATSWTLMEQVTFDANGITSLDWNGYPILRFDEAPTVEVAVIDRPDAPPLGAGEAAQGPAGAAVANAVFDAVGARVRDIPLTPARVKAAMG